MAFATYNDLQSAVGSWLHRADLTPQIPDFITFAEFDLARDLRVAPLVASASVTIPAQGTNGALPAGCMEVLAVRDGASARELRFVTPDAFDRAASALAGLAIPTNYTLIGSALYVAPAWPTGGSLTVRYFRKETPLSAGNSTNWYLGNAPDCLLYAALLQGAPYLVDAQTTQIWQALYKAAVERINAQYNVTGATA